MILPSKNRIGVPSEDELDQNPSPPTQGEVDYVNLTASKGRIAQYERELYRLLKVIDTLREQVADERTSINKLRVDYERASNSLTQTIDSLKDLRWDLFLVVIFQTIGGSLVGIDLRKIESPDWTIYVGVTILVSSYIFALTKSEVKPLVELIYGIIIRNYEKTSKQTSHKTF